jgi:hypothetical protein
MHAEKNKETDVMNLGRNLLYVVFLASLVVVPASSLRADSFVLPGGTPVVTPGDAPVTYTEQAIASGTLGGSSFTSALVTIVFTGDTVNVTGGGGFFTNAVGIATVTVGGIGTATFTDSMEAFDNQIFGPPAAAGIGDITVPGSVLDTFNTVFASYDLTSSIGPVPGGSFIRPDLTFGTTLGGLNISSAGDSTFTAVVSSSATPEPTSLALVGLGSVALAAFRRKRSLRNRAA